jgi:protein O-GlcNAc transferase
MPPGGRSNAHTGASDAFWTGLPVVTCTTDAFAGRVAASLLEAIGFPELVTHSLDQYEELALKLATGRSAVRAGSSRRTRLTFPLFDTDRLRCHIEQAFKRMWEIFQNGETPRLISIAPLRS